MITVKIGKVEHSFPVEIIDNVVTFPRINTINKLGKEMYWQIFVEVRNKKNEKCEIEESYLANIKMPKNLHCVHYVHAGFVNGALRDYEETIVPSGLNIGKKNETNVLIQAIRNANAMYNKQLTLSKKQEGGLISPMLSDIANEKNIPKSAYIQPKLNGVRATATVQHGEIILSTRNKKKINIPHLRNALTGIAKSGIYLDGEIYKHGESLQIINGLVNSSLTNLQTDTRLEYHIFDMYDSCNPDMKFTDRNEWLKNNIIENEYIKLVETRKVDNYTKSDYDREMNNYVNQGYEGVMIRKCDAKYALRRTRDLLKLKPAYDNEYEVVDIEITTKGKTSGAFVFVCQTEEGKTFKVTPKMTIKERKELIKSNKVYEYIGQKITVTYDELSDENTPLRSRTEGIIRSDI